MQSFWCPYIFLHLQRAVLFGHDLTTPELLQSLQRVGATNISGELMSIVIALSIFPDMYCARGSLLFVAFDFFWPFLPFFFLLLSSLPRFFDIAAMDGLHASSTSVSFSLRDGSLYFFVKYISRYGQY